MDDRTLGISPEPNGTITPICRALIDANLMAAPGVVWSYSNAGFTLAGCVIEAVAKAPFGVAVNRTLFQPLGMTRSTYNPRIAMTYPHAQGHDPRGAAAVVQRPYNGSPSITPAGELITTMGDLARFSRALLLDGVVGRTRLLPAGVLVKMTQVQGRGSPFLAGARDYGLGLFVRAHRGLRIAEHEGIYGGFGASLAFAPERQLAVIAVSNSRYSAPVRTTQASLEVLAGLAPSVIETTAMPLTARDSLALAGRYARGTDTLRIESVNGRLSLREESRAWAITSHADGVFWVTGHPPVMPLSANTLEPVNIGADGRAGWVRLSWRAYPRIP